MAPLFSDESEQHVGGYGKSYGNTVVESGGHAILGDVIQDVRFETGVHFHYHLRDIHALHRVIAQRRPEFCGSSER